MREKILKKLLHKQKTKIVSFNYTAYFHFQNLRFPRPPSAPVSPSISRQVSDDEDEYDAEARCNPDPEDVVFFAPKRRSGSESSNP